MEPKQFSDAKEQTHPYDFHNALKKVVESKPDRMLVSITPRDNDYTGSECDIFNDR